jgi:DNA-directed RNA polymerase subunit M/transcription elongation factor TFIIS
MIRCGFSSSEGSSELTSHDRSSALSALVRTCKAIPRSRLVQRVKSMRSDLTAQQIASAIEHGMAVWSEGRSKPYRRKLYSILWAIRNEKKLFAKYDPWDLSWIKEDVLISNSRNREHNINLSPCFNDLISRVESDLKLQLQKFSVRRCPRCKSQDLERIAVQTRSADEGMTQMLQCTSCNHRFK